MSQELAKILDEFPGDRADMLDILADLMREISAPPSDQHAHKCGFSLDDNTVTGCGHVWTHATSEIRNQADYDKAHTCPKCGRAGWFWKHDPVTVREHERQFGKS